MAKYRVVLEDPDLGHVFHGDGRDQALGRLAEAAVAFMVEGDPANAQKGPIIGAALPEAYRMYGRAWPEDVTVDITERV